MRTVLLPLAGLLLCAMTLKAAEPERHFFLRPPHPLTEGDKSDLQSRGVAIQRALPRGEYVVRAGARIVTELQAFGFSVTPIGADRKLQRSALREAAKGRATVMLDVVFYDDVSFDEARRAIAEGGGTMSDPLQIDFRIPRRIAALIPVGSVNALANDERVMLVHGPSTLHPITHNAVSATLSHIDALRTAPYNLAGSGVILSYFELGPPLTSHPEFRAWLTSHFSGGSADDHATHTAGTMTAAGFDASARGMSPAAILHAYDANAADLYDIKASLPSTISAVADNNSWGYAIGWSQRLEGWTWEGSDEYFGAYENMITAPIDQITRANGLLMIHSAGNDAGNIGPQTAPFIHVHADDPASTYCYSEHGTGTDCLPWCSTQYCEIVRHNVSAPWMTIGPTGSAKNALTVGAVDSNKAIASFSSRGPMRDGRVKPELVARGVGVYSTSASGGYTVKSGTSMAAPVVTGAAALLTQLWRQKFNGASPSPAVLRALMIAGAEDLGNAGPDYTYGFGLLNAQASADLVVADAAQGTRIKLSNVAQNGIFEVPVTLAVTQTLRVVLAWTDPEATAFAPDGFAQVALVNDLDVQVVDPNGELILPYALDPANPSAAAVRRINDRDNVEMIEIPGALAGTYDVIVTGTLVTAFSPQPFVLVTTGSFGAQSDTCTAGPASIVATAVSQSQVDVSWPAVPDATYELFRTITGGSTFTRMPTPASNAFSDTTVAGDNAYAYRVRAVCANGGHSSFSPPDVATTFIFSDDPIIAGTTVMKAAHVQQLRTAINALRATSGLPLYNFTPPDISAFVTVIEANQITQLRTALNEARSAIGVPPLTFTDPTPVPASTVIKAAHIEELRSGCR